MNQKQMCLESFTQASFDALLAGLTNEGYVIDGREVLGVPFSSTQIEHLNQQVFDTLCDLFEVNPQLEIRSAGKYFYSQGAFYIVYDKNSYEYESAQQILTKYVNSLPVE